MMRNLLEKLYRISKCNFVFKIIFSSKNFISLRRMASRIMSFVRAIRPGGVQYLLLTVVSVAFNRIKLRPHRTSRIAILSNVSNLNITIILMDI